MRHSTEETFVTDTPRNMRYTSVNMAGGEEMEKVKDLVCGMVIDPKTAAATSEYKGKTYYFCAKGCKIAFDKNPEKYVEDEAKPA